MSKKTISISSKEQFSNLLKSSKLVVADFYADWCGPCRQIAPHFESLSESLSRENVVTFAKINSDNNQDISREYNVSALPTFLMFRDGKMVKKVQGANLPEVQSILQTLVQEVGAVGQSGESGGAGSGSSSGPWKGAEIPRGYSDITEQVEVRNCELLNAAEDAAPVSVLFEGGRPSSLGNEKSTTKDWVQSGSDDQLLLFVPFQSTVKLHTLQLTSVIPANEDDAPSRPTVLRLYLNRTSNIDFDEADELEPTQEIELQNDSWNAEGTYNIPLRYVKFQKTTTLIIYVQKGDGEAETVRINRLRLIGEAGAKREMGKLVKVGEEEE